MNKKEVSEIRKNFNAESGFLTVNRVLTAFVDHEKTIRYSEVRPYITMEESEWNVIEKTLKSILSTKVGKNLIEYAFPNSSYEDDGTQKLLYTLVSDGLIAESETISKYLEKIAENVYFESAYEIITAHCTYTVMQKSNDDSFDEMNTEEYKFIICTLCPAHTGDEGFVFNSDENKLWKKNNSELIVDKAPQVGFMFPAFNNRSSDINSVMCYNKNAKKPNISFVDNFLECEFTFSSELEKLGFQTVLQESLGDELTYNVITEINKALQEFVAVNQNETDIPKVDGQKLKYIISTFGISEDKLNAIPTIYEKVFSNVEIAASNIINSKLTLNFPGIKLTASNYNTDKIRTSVRDGRQCLVIDLDDPVVEINGINVKL